MGAGVSMAIDRSRKSIRACNWFANMAWVAFAVCMVLVSVPPLWATPAKTKDATPKQSSAPELKADPTGASAVNAAADPVVCVKPADPDAAPAAASDEKSSATAKTSAADSETTTDSASEPNSGFMKDKLKLSLGGKSGAAQDQPQQCGIDEAKEK
jgi:hypothetical protein